VRLQTVGFLAVTAGISLVVLAVAGVSALVNPQYSLYYWLGGAGIDSILTGFLVLSFRLWA
jgi:hypothetical protein